MNESTAYEIRMGHPSRNALNTALLEWLDGELDRAGDRPLVLTGEGAFCAGVDLRFVTGLDPAGVLEFLEHLDRVVERLYLHPAPTFAWVDGHAIAGGCVLVQCCDLRLGLDDPKLRIGLNEVAIGACYPPTVLAIVRQRIPVHSIETVLLGAALHPPARARDLGLLDDLAPAEATARERFAAWCDHPRPAYAATKASLRELAVGVAHAERRRWNECEGRVWSSPEVRASLLAVLGG